MHYNSVWFHIFLSLSDANVKFLLELSSELQISRVKERCEQFLKNQECSLANLVVAEKYNLHSLFKRCMDFAKTKTLEELDSSAECKKLSPQTLLKIYHAKIQMLRDYSKELTQKDRQTIKDCENLQMEKEKMKRSLQGIYGQNGKRPARGVTGTLPTAHLITVVQTVTKRFTLRFASCVVKDSI